MQPLRPELYRRLAYLFKHVDIAKQGEPMVTRVHLSAVSGKPKLKILSKGEEYRVTCPYCNDTRSRLYINHMWGFVFPQIGRPLLGLAQPRCHRRMPPPAKPSLPRHKPEVKVS